MHKSHKIHAEIEMRYRFKPLHKFDDGSRALWPFVWRLDIVINDEEKRLYFKYASQAATSAVALFADRLLGQIDSVEVNQFEVT